MAQKEINKELRRMREFGKELANNKALALEILVGVGVMTPDGKLRKGYEDIMLAIELGKKRYT